ncbi:MAG: RDD family protein [Deltaproteobacteria bacterium]|nr:RDD family protein [Deltaproteobacteria bacterium]
MMQYRYGGFWRRWGAMLIDSLILYMILLIFVLAGAAAFRLNLSMSEFKFLVGEFGEMSGAYLVIYYGANLLISMAYYTYFHGTSGQTIGKMIFGLRVVQATGENMTFGIAFLRWVGYLISGLCFYLGFLWAAFDGKKQGWHDKIAATVVIRTRMEPVLQMADLPPEKNEKYLDKENDVL